MSTSSALATKIRVCHICRLYGQSLTNFSSSVTSRGSGFISQNSDLVTGWTEGAEFDSREREFSGQVLDTPSILYNSNLWFPPRIKRRTRKIPTLHQVTRWTCIFYDIIFR